jgi:hypothetical protein
MEINPNDPKTIELNLKIFVDMDNQEADVKNVQVSENPVLSFREKVLAYLRAEVKNRKDEWQGYNTAPLADSELSTEFKLQRTIAETKYWQAVNYLQYFELL